MKDGDPLMFLGMFEADGERIPGQMATCTGLKFSGFVCATLASGREVILPRRFFRVITIGEFKPVP